MHPQTSPYLVVAIAVVIAVPVAWVPVAHHIRARGPRLRVVIVPVAVVSCIIVDSVARINIVGLIPAIVVVVAWVDITNAQVLGIGIVCLILVTSNEWCSVLETC